MQATLLELTVQGIVRSIQSYFPASTEVYLCGGGAHNARLVNRISEVLLEKKVALTDQLGIDVDWVEALRLPGSHGKQSIKKLAIYLL